MYNTDFSAKEMLYLEHLDHIMDENKTEVLKKLSKMVSPDHLEEFAKILSSAWAYECPVAEKIADRLHLTQKDFLAIDEDYFKYKSFIEQEYKEYEISCAEDYYE